MIETEICLRRLVTDRSWYFMDLYQHYSAGHLAVSGGILDQPHVYLEAMKMIDGWMRKP